MSIYDVKVVYLDGNIDYLSIEENYLCKTLKADTNDYLVLESIMGDVLLINMTSVSRIGFYPREV